jgi:hypothetical protein
MISALPLKEKETILPEDYPIYGDYIYICDNNLYRSDWHGITVRQLKNEEGFKEVRRCELVERQEEYRKKKGLS